jgi:hypothetical protein
MAHIYAFNGDADGICALHQLRLAGEPPTGVVTGVKRDTKLLARVQAAPGDRVTVLDVSLDQNRADVHRLLDAGTTLRYFDHHYAGELPSHAGFESHIDTAPDVCTSILVDRHLAHRHWRWAVVAAYGDGLDRSADALAAQYHLDAQVRATYQRLGVLLNYNAYGEAVSDLHFDPAWLADALAPYAEPMDFAADSQIYGRLSTGYDEDMGRAQALQPLSDVPGACLLVLPDEAWARRVIGVLANKLMESRPLRAVALLSPRTGGGYTVSVRVAAGNDVGADDFCRGFDTGGGRKTAAGVNKLPAAALQDFAGRFVTTFRRA